MEQAQIKQELQQKIFSHPIAKQFNAYSQSILSKLSKCHTIKLGVHVYRCDSCEHQHYQYHSCSPDSYREWWIKEIAMVTG